MTSARLVSRIVAGAVFATVATSCANDYTELELAAATASDVGAGGAGGSAQSSASGPDETGGAGASQQQQVGGGGGASAGGTGGTAEGGAGAGAAGGGAVGAGGAGGVPGGSGGSGSGGSPPVVSCAEQYPNHMLCIETSTECEIYVALGGVESCIQHCNLFGGECLEVWDDVGNSCDHLGPLTCSGMNGDALCVCSHGCGNGPACPGGQTCSGGACN